MHTLSGANVAAAGTVGIISEGALGALVNSHINEGMGNLSSCNESFENQNNILYWTNQNHNQHHEVNRAEAGTTQ